jgi:multicomponent Na+:H+ antiporter subunit D
VSLESALLPLIVLSSLVTGLVIFFLDEDRVRLRTALNLAGATAKLLLVGFMMVRIYGDAVFEWRLALLPGIDFLLYGDPLATLFVSLSAALWFVTTLYAVGYLEGSPNRSRFFGFFSVCVSATTGVALAGNLLTFVIFYELLTVSTYPLVVHRGTEKALRAGRSYLAYTLGGGAVLLLAVIWLYVITGEINFAATGVLSGLVEKYPGQLTFIFFLLIAGLGVKAALVPLHSWLPRAMIAPAPVSALLHAVAVVKAGAFGIVRVVYDVYGVKSVAALGLMTPLAIAASVTIIFGSLAALFQGDLKRRLAFSTISQVSYIILGASVFGPTATVGGLVHLVHQGIMKITLFFCAGNYAETLGIHKISELPGVGRRMPWTTAAFTIAALGMIGVPPAAGFVTKWFLGTGAMEAGQYWVIGVLVASGLLNALYFLPIVYASWFGKPAAPWPEDRQFGRWETHWMLLAPPLVTAALVLAMGLFANAPFSPLWWVRFIAAREYGL